jgi:hypothetical protein
MFNDPCEVCGVRRLDHEPTQVRHRYQSPVLPPESFYNCEFWDILNNTTGGTVERAIMPAWGEGGQVHSRAAVTRSARRYRQALPLTSVD